MGYILVISLKTKTNFIDDLWKQFMCMRENHYNNFCNLQNFINNFLILLQKNHKLFLDIIYIENMLTIYF